MKHITLEQVLSYLEKVTVENEGNDSEITLHFATMIKNLVNHIQFLEQQNKELFKEAKLSDTVIDRLITTFLRKNNASDSEAACNGFLDKIKPFSLYDNDGEAWGNRFNRY